MPGRSKLSPGRIQQDKVRDSVTTMSSSKGWGEWALSIAKVEQVNYEELVIKVRIMTGEEDIFSPTPIPITWPSAGRRMIAGHMPMSGDYCVIGWMIQESSGQASSRTPVILSWFAPPYWMGHDWIPGQEYAPGEGQDTPAQRASLEGSAERVRFKLGHLDPGNYIASSAQGADLILDEGILLTNRRANELMLRDADQAFVVRSVSQFHTMGGARIYAGPVQRDATYLPTQMFSDGLYWDTPQQVGLDTGDPVTDRELAQRSGRDELGGLTDEDEYRWPPRFLTPGRVFQRDPGDDLSDFEDQEDALRFDPSLDPFTFLKWGGFITEDGFAGPGVEAEAIYGGKAIYRVSIDSDESLVETVRNAVIADRDGELNDSLTEYRIEMTHTYDGTLPVSEQVDGFDADRLPEDSPGTRNPLDRLAGASFVEWVIGSVVGNDAFTEAGRQVYGLPMVPQVFDPEGNANPGMVSGLGRDVREHAATLLRVSPPFSESVPPTFFSVTKDGRVRAFIAGPTNEQFGAEIYISSGFRFRVDGEFAFETGASLSLSGEPGAGSGYGVDMSSEQGAVRIFGGGRALEGAQAERFDPNGDESSLPSVLIEGRENVEIRGNQAISLSAPNVQVQNTSSVTIDALQSVGINAGDNIRMATKVFEKTITGRSLEVFSGPKDALPTNGSVRRIDIVANPVTGFFGGANDEYFNLFGDRDETFVFGNHTTTCQVGNLTYETNVGRWKCRALGNSITVNPAGMTATMATGNIALNASAGALTSQSSVGATIRTTGPAILSGAASVFLGGPGKIGPIVSGADLDPLTGIPLIALGLGSPGHTIGTPV